MLHLGLWRLIGSLLRIRTSGTEALTFPDQPLADRRPLQRGAAQAVVLDSVRALLQQGIDSAYDLSGTGVVVGLEDLEAGQVDA
jgi:hypothetical protein